jgi:hypothetical protein
MIDFNCQSLNKSFGKHEASMMCGYGFDMVLMVECTVVEI